MRSVLRPLAMLPLLAVTVVACGESPPPNAYMTTPGGGSQYVKDSEALGEVRLRPEACSDVPENKPERTRLGESALAAFLQRQGYEVREARARADLVYFDVTGQGISEPVRLRVAVLEDAHAAGKDLHNAVLQHGSGSWGVHRGNLAVLG